MNILETFSPRFNADLDAYQRFKNPEPRDLHKKFGPTLATVCNVVGVDPARATALIDTWDPTNITMETIHAAVRALTAPTVAAHDAARAKQEALEAELARDAAAHPLTARDRVLLERKKPLSERSRDSILRELFEIRTGCMRLDEPKDGGGWGGERLPGVVWEMLEANGRDGILQGELDARDCREHGVDYVPPVKVDHSLDMAPRMRG